MTGNKQYVIVETTNRFRGDDCVGRVFCVYATEDEAYMVCAELSAFLPAGYDSHEDYDVQYGVHCIYQIVTVGSDSVRVSA